MLQGFKKFIAQGNVMDLAVAVIIGAAFGKIVTALVDSITMPLIGLIIGGLDFSSLAITVGSAKVGYGAFIQALVDFLIIAAVIFLMVHAVNSLKKPAPAAAPTAKDCPFCFTTIPIKATRCPNCTSALT
jgi:large conductance mechanosensitive channel